MKKKHKIIKRAQYWGKSSFVSPEFVARKFNDKPTDWIMEKSMMIDDMYVQNFISIGETKWNWILKLWVRLNKTSVNNRILL